MKNNSFIWTDLSSYNPLLSIRFYETVFNWKFHNSDGYHVAYQDSKEIVGLYETPDFFKKIKMPHFWMNYIKVENSQQVVQKARELGGRVELENEAFYGGQIALIRDPMGAGFTIYEGKQLTTDSQDPNGSVKTRELHTSNAKITIDFYTQLFNWKIKQSNFEKHFDIFNNSNNKIATLSEIQNDVKGKYEYWVTSFAVYDLQNTRALIQKAGGKLISDEGYRYLYTDNSGEAFFYIEEK